MTKGGDLEALIRRELEDLRFVTAQPLADPKA